MRGEASSPDHTYPRCCFLFIQATKCTSNFSFERTNAVWSNHITITTYSRPTLRGKQSSHQNLSPLSVPLS